MSVSSNCFLAVTFVEGLDVRVLFQPTEQEVEDSWNVLIAQQRSLTEGLGALKLVLSRVQGPLALDEACHLAEQALGGLAGVDRHCSPCPR